MATVRSPFKSWYVVSRSVPGSPFLSVTVSPPRPPPPAPSPHRYPGFLTEWWWLLLPRSCGLFIPLSVPSNCALQLRQRASAPIVGFGGVAGAR